MSSAWNGHWSDSPNAPQISYILYFSEKSYLAGSLLCAISYGIVVVSFFQCTSALLNPINHRNGGIKWPLVIHTSAMFSFVTVYTAMYLNLQSISFIGNREYTYTGANVDFPPGPFGYQHLIYNKAISFVPHIAFMLNTWLADGLLLYRCYVIYFMNYWVIAFPCLMYLASFAMGIVYMYYQISQPTTVVWGPIPQSFHYPFFAISPSLNILLTLMIVTRLIFHRRNIRDAMGSSAGPATGLYKAIVTILVESCALYAASFILFLGPWGTSSPVANIFFPVLAEAQVLAPLIIVQRVANHGALTSETVVSGVVDSIRFKNRSVLAIDSGKNLSELDAGLVDTTIELHHRDV